MWDSASPGQVNCLSLSVPDKAGLAPSPDTELECTVWDLREIQPDLGKHGFLFGIGIQYPRIFTYVQLG